MKKLFVLLAICSFVVGCQKEEVEKPNLGAKALSNRISPYEAIDFAIDVLYDDATRGYNAPRATVSIYGTEQTRSGESVDSMFYFVNFENNGGYAIVSTDRRAGDVIAFSRSGNIDPDSIEDGSAMDMVISLAEFHYWEIIEPSDSLTPIIPEDYLDYPKVVGVSNWSRVDSIGPYIEMKWHQHFPFNSHSPYVNGRRAPAGCWTIALGQVMSRYQYPKSHNGIEYRWGLLLQTNPFITNTEDYQNHMGEVIADIGQTIGIVYDDTISTASIYDAQAAAQEFGYHTSVVSTTLVPRNPSLIYCVRGQELGKPNPNNAGHAFVVDGYISDKRVTTYMDYDVKMASYYFYNVDEYRCFLHCNWGDGAPEYCIYEVIQPSGQNSYGNFANFSIIKL